MTPEQHLAAAIDGMPELAEALAELRRWTCDEIEGPSDLGPYDRHPYLLGYGRSTADHLLGIIDRAAGQ